MKTLSLFGALAVLLPTLAAAEPPPPPMPPQHPGMHREGGPGGMHEAMLHHLRSVAPKLGIPADTVKKIEDMGFESQEAMIGLEADHQRAQLQLERELAAPSPDEAKVMQKLEAASKAELAVRKNHLGLMLKVRKLLGPESWEKLQAEMHRGEMEHHGEMRHEGGEHQ